MQQEKLKKSFIDHIPVCRINRELFQKVKELGGVSDSGPQVLGVMMSCAHNFANLADMDFDQKYRDRLFFSLFNARLVLSILRHTLGLRRLEYPEDLSRLTLARSNLPDVPQIFERTATGVELFEWSRDIESKVCDALDSLDPESIQSLPGLDRLFSLKLFGNGNLLIDGIPTTEKLLLMLDDTERLTKQQRQLLLGSLFESRAAIGVWVAERFEALDTDEMLSTGALEGRDYSGIIALENYWRSRTKQFEKVVVDVANRRTEDATAIDVPSFSHCLNADSQSGLNADQYRAIFEKLRTAAIQAAQGYERFDDWISQTTSNNEMSIENAIRWRALTILIEREKRRKQQAFDFGLDASELEKKRDNSVESAAELFLSKEYNLPYYYGTLRLAWLASSNIEQFLWLAGNHFEEVIALRLLKRKQDPLLSPVRQDGIIRESVSIRFDEIPRRLPNGRDVKRFIGSIGEFARWQTYQPNAPYAPGVTGIAISMRDRDRLLDKTYLKRYPEHRKLAETLASALAFNLLEPLLDAKCKGSEWMILYLNRFLCAHFSLPLHSGGWREKSLSEISGWIEKGYRSPDKEGTLYE